jgi:hypothetical protein
MTQPQPSRRGLLKAAAGATLGSAIGLPAGAAPSPIRIDRRHVLTPQQAWQWASFKAQGGPTYAGSAGWKRYTDFLVAKLAEFGAVDLDHVDIPYDHYIVEDWPDPKSHQHDSETAVLRLVSDGTPVPVVASYGMTSGATPPQGITAPMLWMDPAHPPAPEQIAGKILVVATALYPSPPWSNFFLDNFTITDTVWRSPGTWPPLFQPPPTSVMTSYHSRWVWSQLNGFAEIAIKGHAAGMVVVYDLSPGAAFGLAQRSVYTADGKAGLGAQYISCPTLTLDRVHGAKVLADAKSGRTATLTLAARFQRDTGRAFLAHLPGRDYGTEKDEQVLLATHTDAMSLIEENGGLGMLGILSYWNSVPRAARPRTLVFYFDCRHFMPGGESSWPQYDYYAIHQDRLKPIVVTLGMEHMGGRQTIETGPGGNHYAYSTEAPENGGVITSLFDVYNNNPWLIDAIARAATDNRWPRVDAKTGNVEPGIHGGFQGLVKSPVNKGRVYKIPGVGLAGDWPGAWTQTYAQLDTEAGPHGFDPVYFTTQVAGLSQIAGEMMLARPNVIDLGWGELKSALVKLQDADFAKPADAAATRRTMLDAYLAAFRQLETGAASKAGDTLKHLSTTTTATLTPDHAAAITVLVDRQRAKIA